MFKRYNRDMSSKVYVFFSFVIMIKIIDFPEVN